MAAQSPSETRIGVVVIGRNEGERLKASLRSVPSGMPIVYVDSGSTDGSPEWARSQGVRVVDLPVPPPFTAARARNAGMAALLAEVADLDFVQMLDGDCELAPEWVATAAQFLRSSPEVAAVFGRLRERQPEASLYNRICQAEWDGPVGPVASCGGIALFRVEALRAAGGYTESLIAGEEPDLCLRMRSRGWKIVRIDADMALHDAAMTRLGQYWKRTERSGHAFAELSDRHRSAEPKWRRQVLSILVWAAALPLAILAVIFLALIVGLPALAVIGLGLLLLYPLQVVRLGLRSKDGLSPRDRMTAAALLMLGKFAQLRGAMRYWRSKALAKPSALIEYKDVG
jgi:GT2 family glycosyltransferase